MQPLTHGYSKKIFFLLIVSQLVLPFQFYPSTKKVITFSSSIAFAQSIGNTPQITSVTPRAARIEGGTEVVIKGNNFSANSMVVLGDAVATNVVVENETTIRFRVPAQKFPGNRTLTVKNAQGMAQHAFGIMAKPLSELAAGEITTVAGGIPYIGDGKNGMEVQGIVADGIALDNAGNIFFTDVAHNRVRKLDLVTRIITTVAGTGARTFNGDGQLALTAGLDFTLFNGGVTFDTAGNMFIADAFNNRIRRVDAKTEIITTMAGNGEQSFGGDGGLATQASFSIPSRVVIDSVGDLVILDRFNKRICRVDIKTGIIRL
jgi:hypothetical protein